MRNAATTLAALLLALGLVACAGATDSASTSAGTGSPVSETSAASTSEPAAAASASTTASGSASAGAVPGSASPDGAGLDAGDAGDAGSSAPAATFAPAETVAPPTDVEPTDPTKLEGADTQPAPTVPVTYDVPEATPLPDTYTNSQFGFAYTAPADFVVTVNDETSSFPFSATAASEDDGSMVVITIVDIPDDFDSAKAEDLEAEAQKYAEALQGDWDDSQVSTGTRRLADGTSYPTIVSSGRSKLDGTEVHYEEVFIQKDRSLVLIQTWATAGTTNDHILAGLSAL